MIANEKDYTKKTSARPNVTEENKNHKRKDMVQDSTVLRKISA
ncbi:hypothetical protein RO3G_07717 [Rhizopus delemar RA 99-880]|nr:hypothetical protein RO3G_07717 [Rhizopus delemar RA 99-880]|eukprot:EIE83012.1 hypothetical protein RO3G_07717 [Rhizopus delemar RA 99-880]